MLEYHWLVTASTSLIMSEIKNYKIIFEITVQVFERNQAFATKKGAKARLHY